jgi:threonine aldolase
LPDLDRNAVRARCERSLSWDAPRRSTPKAILTRIAEACPADLAADAYGEGDLLRGFEEEVAALLGKESAVFMVSGTMAQQIALRIWADRRRLPRVAFHPTCHLEIHEEEAYARLHGLAAKRVGPRTGLIAPADLARLAEPIAALLLELPQRELGGVLPPWSDLEAIAAWCRERGTALHLDGARLWETRPFYHREYAEIAGLFDSVYVSCYKGLGGIAGSVLAGPASFTAEARVWLRRHGGNLVSVYPYVLAAKSGLAERLPRMGLYHEKAIAVARRLSTLPGVEIVPDPPHTNMMHVALRAPLDGLERAALEVADETSVWLFGKVVPTGVPSYQRVELALCEGALEIDTDEIGRLFEAVLERANRQVLGAWHEPPGVFPRTPCPPRAPSGTKTSP